jgi:hypothetical protein
MRPAQTNGHQLISEVSGLEGDQHDDRGESRPAAAMVWTFADALLSAEADALRNAEYGGQVGDERVNHRNGYRAREWDTRAGTVELAVSKHRSDAYFTAGSSNAAAGPSRLWSRWSPPLTSWASAPAGPESSPSPSAPPSLRHPRCAPEDRPEILLTPIIVSSG